MFGKKKNKNVKVGMGSSKLTDPYKAAIEAAKEAIKEFGKEATFSIVYTNSNYDQKEFLKGCNEVLGKNWVGSTVDKQISSKYEFNPETTITILSFYSDYLHFGIGVSENYIKKPKESGSKAIKDAMKNAKADKYVDSYVQFTRTKTKDYSSIVKTPPYFVFAIAGSQTKKNGNYVGGGESGFLEGILQETGPHIPIFGLGSGSDFFKFIDDNTKDLTNYQFAKGKLYENSGIAIFVISNVYFEIEVQHGYEITSDFTVVNKVDKTGFEILELNGNKNPVEEYCRLTKIKKADFLKDPFMYSLKRPFGVVALDNSTYIKEAYPNPDGKTLHCSYKLRYNTVMNILKYNKKKLETTMSKILEESKKENKNKNVAIALFTNCCSRRLLMEGEEDKANNFVLKNNKNIPFFGCYAFSEIGSTKTNIAQVHGETVTSLILYDNLLSDK